MGGAAPGEAAADGYFEEGGAGGAGKGPVGARLCVVLLPAPMLYIGVQSERMPVESVAPLCVCVVCDAWVSGSTFTQVWPHSVTVNVFSLTFLGVPLPLFAERSRCHAHLWCSPWRRHSPWALVNPLRPSGA